ncbi:LOW QUALITY PROTEIN: hypothetical protein N665_0197s0057 [Sinapis alba]|nr:LOW QUALITY PROTEIN: hypothetical protein N665_0197s0057 [Sinapis alba]
MAGGKAPARLSFSVSFVATFGLSMSFLLLSRRSFASGYLDTPILVASPLSLTFFQPCLTAAHPLSSYLALFRRPAYLWLSSSSFTFTDAGSPPLKSSDLPDYSISFAKLLCSLQNMCGYDVLITPIMCSLMFFIGTSLALVRVITAVCSLCFVDIGSLIFTSSCELLSSRVGPRSAVYCLNRTVLSASSCSAALMLIMSLGFSASLPVPISSCCCYDSTRVRVNDILFALVQSSTVVYSPLHLFTPNYDSIRWFSLPMWQCEELIFDISTQSLNLGVFSTFSFMELGCFPYPPLVFSGCVAGSIVSKLTYTLLSGFRKGLAKWSLVTYALTAEFMIVYSTLCVVSILGFRALYMLSKSLSSISSFCIIGVEDRGLLHDFSCLAMMFAFILGLFVLRFVITVCLAGLALLLFTLNNCSMDGV